MIKKNHSVHLVFPAYLGSAEHFVAEINEEVDSQQKLLPAKQSVVPTSEALLFNLLFGKSKTKLGDKPVLPYARISALGNGLSFEENWLRFDPIELQVDAGNIFLIGRDHLCLNHQETTSLLQILNDFLRQDGLHIVPGKPCEWYVKLPTAISIASAPFYKVLAKDIRQFLLDKNEKHIGNKLITELQMLLFTHQINQRRQMNQQPVISSVWPWGQGKPIDELLLKNYDLILSDHSLVKGMHQLSKQGIPLITENEQAINCSHLEEPGQYLIAINHFEYPFPVIAHFLLKLIEKIKSRSLKELNIYLGSGNQLQWRLRKRFFY